MARQWRIEYEGALYHVLSRGNEKRDIFSDEKDRSIFLDTLGQMAYRFEVEVHAYVLMNNHYHLLLKTLRSNLSRSLQWFGATYTRRYNVRHGRSGHLFQGRYKNILVENETYLMNLSCYIHRNPLRAGIVHRLVDYRWSTYSVYAYGKDHPLWLKTSLILSKFPVKDKNRGYRERVQKYSKEEKRILENIRHGMFLGSRLFIERIKANYLKEEVQREIPQQNWAARNRDPEEVLKKGAELLKCDVQQFKSSARVRKSDLEKRDLLIYLLWETGLYRGWEIGRLFGLSYSSVSYRADKFRSQISQDKQRKEQYDKIKSIIKM